MSKPAAWPRKVKLMATPVLFAQAGNHIVEEEKSKSQYDNDHQDLAEDSEVPLVAVEGRANLAGVDFLHSWPLRRGPVGLGE